MPDFPTGGLADTSAYGDGNGKILVRARLDASDLKRIVIREIPFGTTTQQLIESVEAAAREKKVPISKINDYTAEIVEIELMLPHTVRLHRLRDIAVAKPRGHQREQRSRDAQRDRHH